MLPDDNKLEDNSRDFLTDILNLFSSPSSPSSSGPLKNTCNDPEKRAAEVEILASGVNSLKIDNESEQRCETGDSSDEDIFLTDDEECDENFQVQSPSAGNNLPDSLAADDRQSYSFSKENNNERVDKGLECDLDGDEVLDQGSQRNITDILKDLIESVVSVKLDNDMDSLEEEDISGEESFEECEEEYEDDEESDMFEDDSESDEEDESCSDPSWQADQSEDDDEETEDLKTKTLRADNKNLTLVKERLDSSGMDSGSLSFYMSETGPISVQV